MGPHGVPGLPPTKPQPSTNSPALHPPTPYHYSISHALRPYTLHRHKCPCTVPQTQIMHIAQRVFRILIPPMVINLKIVKRGHPPYFMLGVFCNLCSFSFSQRLHQPLPELQSFFIYVFPCENTQQAPLVAYTLPDAFL